MTTLEKTIAQFGTFDPPSPVSNEEIADFADSLLAEKDAPLCSVHKLINERGDFDLALRIGNSCLACSLNERYELLELLAPYADGDSVGTLRKLIEKIKEKTDVDTRND